VGCPEEEGREVTVETRATIESRDILALEVECSTCGSRVRYPLLKIQPDLFRSRQHPCPNCKDALLPAGSPEVNRVAEFAQALQTLIKSETQAIIRLEVGGLNASPAVAAP
jgi:RNase P subunit RPR2